MRSVIEPGKSRKSINFIDNIIYSRVKDLSGKSMELKMSVMLQNGNSEMRLVMGRSDEEDKTPKPAILWIPGGGYRGCDKNLMVGEMTYLVDAGYVVASMYYRSSAEGHMPDQIIDVKTAIRFLRAHAEEYEIDPSRIGVMGRSAGGHLSSLAAMNEDRYHGSEWSGFSDKVQACCDMFGPTDLRKLLLLEEKAYKADPAGYRWASVEESHGGALLGGDYNEEMLDKAESYSPQFLVNEGMAPILILHGDKDKLIPVEISEDFYKAILEKGLGDKADLMILHGAGHGTKEFFQPSVREQILNFFDEKLKM